MWWSMIYLCLFFKDDYYSAEEVGNLKSLVSNLRQLLDLHRKYNCRLSLSVFEKVWLVLVIHSKYVWASSKYFIKVCVKLYEKSPKPKVYNHVGTQVMLIYACRCQWRTGEIALFYTHYGLHVILLWKNIFTVHWGVIALNYIIL